MSYYDCKDCNSFFVQCPCCRESFCPDCGKTETDQEEDDETE